MNLYFFCTQNMVLSIWRYKANDGHKIDPKCTLLALEPFALQWKWKCSVEMLLSHFVGIGHHHPNKYYDVCNAWLIWRGAEVDRNRAKMFTSEMDLK